MSNQNKKNLFSDKVVIITGASSGIGEACAIAFASEGAKIVLAARNVEKLSHVEKAINDNGGLAVSIATDVRKEEDCHNLISQTIDMFGQIDILINNAGLSMRANFETVNLSVIKELMDTNFYGTVYCTKFALPFILKQKGSVIGISSIAGLAPMPGRTGYCASKSAMNGFLNALRLECIKKGLHVMTVYPGFTSTNIRFTALNKDGVPQKDTPRDESKMMTSEKVAQRIVWATAKRKRDLIFTTQGKFLNWLYKRFPAFADKLIYNEIKKEPDSPF